MIEFAKWLLELSGFSTPQVLAKTIPDAELKFRVVRSYNKFYIEVEYFPDCWDMIGFNDSGILSRHVFDNGRDYANSEDACAIARRLNAGERQFPEYDKRGYAIIDCSCEQPK